MDQSRSQGGATSRRTENRKVTRDQPCRADEAVPRMRFACSAARRHASILRTLGSC
jgi:hypothetical protein